MVALFVGFTLCELVEFLLGLLIVFSPEEFELNFLGIDRLDKTFQNGIVIGYFATITTFTATELTVRVSRRGDCE